MLGSVDRRESSLQHSAVVLVSGTVLHYIVDYRQPTIGWPRGGFTLKQLNIHLSSLFLMLEGDLRNKETKTDVES
jgi:hypothetical protein